MSLIAPPSLDERETIYIGSSPNLPLGHCARIPELCAIVNRGGERDYDVQVAPFSTKGFRVGSGSPKIVPLEIEVLIDKATREDADGRGAQLLQLCTTAQVVWWGAIRSNQDLPFTLGQDKLSFNKKRRVLGLMAEPVTPSNRLGQYTIRFKFVTLEQYWRDSNDLTIIL